MREMDPKLEPSGIAQARAGGRTVSDAAGTGVARLGETRGTAREFKNTGNKARMLMKTNHITFEGCKSGALGAPIGTNQAVKRARAIWETEVRLLVSEGGAEHRTKCRLDKMEAFQRRLSLTRATRPETGQAWRFRSGLLR